MVQRLRAKRGTQWQYYRRVPADLVDEIGCQFWRESLRTDSRKLAEQRVVAHVHRTNLLIDAARSGTLPDETIRETAYAWRWSGIDLGNASFSEVYDLRDEVAESIRR